MTVCKTFFPALFILSLSPVRAQEVVTVPVDTLGLNIEIQEEPLLSDSSLVAPSPQEVAATDSLSTGSDSLQMVVEEPKPVVPEVVLIWPDNPAFLTAWRHHFPMGTVSERALAAAKADSLHPSALRRWIDTLPASPTLSYAQQDLRMPLSIGSHIPEPQTASIGQLAQSQMGASERWTEKVDNPYLAQLEYARIRQSALHECAVHHLSSVKRFSPEDYDLPTERKRIERQELSGDEHVDTDLALELETTGLQIDQVTFHADKWHRKGTTDLQISQTALSDNWYKGGDNNMTLSTYDKLVFSRYDESMKSTFDITLELRLSGYYTKADTIHPMRVSDNQFRIDISYGYKAYGNWYYSASSYIKTPVFEYFNANSRKVKSNFFSPLEFNLAAGMELKATKNKRFNYNLMMAPVSYNLKSVSDDRIEVTSYGIEKGKRSLNQFGSALTWKFEWKVSDAVTWTSRSYLFTSYHNFLLEFENTFNVAIGRYTTGKFYFYPRFDDLVDHHFQLKEMLTFGMAFAW